MDIKEMSRKRFGAAVRTYREAANMSQEELAAACGFAHKSSISKIELGDRDVRQGMILTLASALGVSPAELLDYGAEDTRGADAVETLREIYGSALADTVEMLLRLDAEDRAEIRGEIKGMLRAGKYTAQPKKDAV